MQRAHISTAITAASRETLVAVSSMALGLLALGGCNRAQHDPLPSSTGTLAGAGTPPSGTLTGTTSAGTVESTALPVGCFSMYRAVGGTDDWQLVLLPDAPGASIQQTWTIQGSSSQWPRGDVFGLEYFDGRFWVCNDVLIEVDPVGGVQRATPQRCDTLTVLDGTLQVAPQGAHTEPWSVFRSAQSARDGVPDETLNRFGWPQMARGTDIGGAHYVAWHNGDAVSVVDPTSGDWRSLPLSGFDTWFSGVSHDATGPDLRVLDDGRAVTGTEDDNVYLWRFDSQSGIEVSERIVVGHFLTHNYGGLYCGEPVIDG